MREKEKLQLMVDKSVDKAPAETFGTKARTVLEALAAWILFMFAKEGFAQDVKVYDPVQTGTETAYQTPDDMSDSTISFSDVVSLSDMESDTTVVDSLGWWDEPEEWEAPVEESQKQKSKIEIHGSVRWGSEVTPLLWSVLSDRPALILTLDVSNPQTWLWASVIRADDFSKSMENPASQVTLVDLYWQKKFWKVWVTAVWEYASIDKLPWAESITPLVWVTYDAWKWWIFDAWVWHTFQKWEDVDMLRIWVTKKLDEAFSVAAQVFYNSELAKKVYIRVQADVSFGKWFGAQLSFIYKEGKLTPTMWVVYGF